MKWISFISAVIVIFLLSACAKQPTREQILQMQETVKESQTRIYDEDPKLILKACEAVLHASDHDYHAMPEQSDSVYTCKRNYFFTLILSTVMGEDYWKITAVKNNDGKTVVNVRSWSGPRSAGMIPLPVTSGGDTNNNYLSKQLYRLFFERLEYVLGKRQEWPTCKEAQQWVKEDKSMFPGGVAPLCEFGNSDVPNRLK